MLLSVGIAVGSCPENLSVRAKPRVLRASYDGLDGEHVPAYGFRSSRFVQKPI